MGTEVDRHQKKDIPVEISEALTHLALKQLEIPLAKEGILEDVLRAMMEIREVPGLSEEHQAIILDKFTNLLESVGEKFDRLEVTINS